MSNNSSVSKTVMLPAFSGKDKDYAVFWPRFKAYATLKKVGSVLNASKSNLPNDPTVLSVDPDAKKLQEKAIKLNNEAMTAFTMAFEMADLMEFIES